MIEDEDEPKEGYLTDDIESILRRQDEALALLDRLRSLEPLVQPKTAPIGGGRRDFRRWPLPPGVALELHDGERWRAMTVTDLGVGGVRLHSVPGWVEGPLPARLTTPTTPPTLVLADIMWRDGKDKLGLRFEFTDNEERDLWSGGLIDALLARHAVE